MDCLPVLSVNGNLSPELIKAVVLPLPGGPMMMYQGREYKFSFLFKTTN